jgi:hypothetical protein
MECKAAYTIGYIAHKGGSAPLIAYYPYLFVAMQTPGYQSGYIAMLSLERLAIDHLYTGNGIVAADRLYGFLALHLGIAIMIDW